MRRRPNRRDLVMRSSPVDPADSCGDLRYARLARTRRIRRFVRIGALLTVIGLMHLARAVRPCWRSLLTGVVLTVAGLMQRGGVGGLILVPGLLFLWDALLTAASPHADRKRRFELERELAGYSTRPQRCDLEATLDRYPDGITYELRDILASQATAAHRNGIPGAGRH
jgi:hypothetical protein